MQVKHRTCQAECAYEPAEYWPQYMFSVSDATAVPAVFGTMSYGHERGSQSAYRTRTLVMSCLGVCRSLLRLDRMALEKLALPLRDRVSTPILPNSPPMRRLAPAF